MPRAARKVRADLRDVCRVVRDHRLQSLVSHLVSPAEAYHQGALMCLSNLASEALDPEHFQTTRERLKETRPDFSSAPLVDHLRRGSRAGDQLHDSFFG